eukprot:TRINITY_DN14780_c0_g1_i2.p1 TRINITY_DN14780_c0_g1~~TRINITY_DN14780_c0_g1_i2.p1  ORF type:complete len:161 (-),score=23.29 TRINITY_DN14780_c0_g1_i2:54-536(-)
MHNGDTLSVAISSSEAPHLKIGLSRWRVPDSLCHELLVLTWQGFLAFSKNCGETIDGARVASLMRYAGLYECATLIDDESEIPGSLTFAGFLFFLAELKESFIASSNEQGIREIDLAEDSDDDSEESDDERSIESRLAELDDADLSGDARLILKGRHNAS